MYAGTLDLFVAGLNVAFIWLLPPWSGLVWALELTTSETTVLTWCLGTWTSLWTNPIPCVRVCVRACLLPCVTGDLELPVDDPHTT